MKTWVVVYSRTYDPGLVLCGTVLGYDIIHALNKARVFYEISFDQIRSIVQQ